MKLSVDTHVLREHFSDEIAVKMIKETGFDAYDYSFFWATGEKDMLGDDYRERAQMLRKAADEVGIVCNQAHAPFEVRYTDDFDESNAHYSRLVRSLEAASILGSKNIIVHAIKSNLPETVDFYELNRRFYLGLLPYCKKFQICVSVENLFVWIDKKCYPLPHSPQKHMEFVRSLGSEWFNICIDVGHSALSGFKPEEVIRAMDPDLLKALHIHDHDLVDDYHLLPYSGVFDWNAITQALGEVGYTGDFNFEIFGFLQTQDPENLPAALRFAAETGRLLIRKIEGGKDCMKALTSLPEGYQEILSIDLQKQIKPALLVNLLGAVIMIAMAVPMHFVVPIGTLFDMEQGMAAYFLRFASLLVLLVVYMVLHELVHGITMRLCGTKKIKYGFTGLYAFAGSEDYYGKGSYILIALAPVVILGVILAVINPFVPKAWFWVVYILQISNLSGAAGDCYVTVKFSRLPKDILVKDYGVGMTVYSKGNG